MVRSKNKDSLKDDSYECEISMSEVKKKLVPANKTSRSTSPKSDISTTEDASNATPPLRVGGRMKKAKIVFDPSDNYIPRRKYAVAEKIKSKTSSNLASSSSSKSSESNISHKNNINLLSKLNKRLSTSSNVSDKKKYDDKSDSMELDSSLKSTNYYSGLCLMCLKQGTESDMLSCSVMYCNYKAHLQCLNLGGDDFDLTLLQNNWQCPHCKTCVVCFENTDAGVLTICSICGDAYHSICNTPRITEDDYPLDDWKCMHCARLKVQIKTTNLGHVLPITIKPKSYGDKPILKQEKVKTDQAILQEEHIPLTPPPSQPSSITITQQNDDNRCDTSSETYPKDDKEEFIGFSDHESSEQLKKLATTSNLLNIKRHNDEILNTEINITEELINETLKRKSIEELENNNVPKKKISDIIAMKLKENEIFNSKNELSIPDIYNWTCADVCQYFYKYFPDHSHIFEDQQIDGSSLLLLKRSDVINGLNLKLGPALKLYRHILMLQTKSSDPLQSWL